LSFVSVIAHNRLLTINPEQPPTVHNGFVWQRCQRLGDCGITASEILAVPGTKLDVPAGLDDFGCSRPVSVLLWGPALCGADVETP
jgi:hypothetical protein